MHWYWIGLSCYAEVRMCIQSTRSCIATLVACHVLEQICFQQGLIGLGCCRAAVNDSVADGTLGGCQRWLASHRMHMDSLARRQSCAVLWLPQGCK
jgi:hypothetical protein